MVDMAVPIPDGLEYRDRRTLGVRESMNRSMMMGAAAAALFAASAIAQTPANPPGQNGGAAPAAGAARGAGGAGRGGGRGAGGGANGINPGFNSGGAGIGSADVPALIFEEHWRDIPMSEPATQQHLSNQNLVLHLYGDTDHIRATQHPTEAYTYTGETRTNWALTLSDPKNYWDLSGTGKVMLRTRNSGYRFTHIVIKTADGQMFASE